jgi:hypothetical protein
VSEYFRYSTTWSAFGLVRILDFGHPDRCVMRYAGNFNPQRSHKMLPLNEKAKVLNFLRKEKDRILRLLRSKVKNKSSKKIVTKCDKGKRNSC